MGMSAEMPAVTTKICTARVKDRPEASSLPYTSLALSAIFMPRLMKIVNRINTAASPTNPISSPMAARIKSDSATGTFWGNPEPNPEPVTPPVDMPNRAWESW